MQAEQIRSLYLSKAYRIQRKEDVEEQEKKSKWNRYTVLPSDETQFEFEIRMKCYDASNDNPAFAEDLYNNYTLLDVEKILLIRRATLFK